VILVASVKTIGASAGHQARWLRWIIVIFLPARLTLWPPLVAARCLRS